MDNFKSGFISIVGRPNVGKSTLTNLLAGENIAIVSNKPQTTRNKIQAVLTRDDFQAVFIDTPGIHTPTTKLGQYMVKSAEGSMKDVDLILYMVAPLEKISEGDKKIMERLARQKAPKVLVINKCDTVSRNAVLGVIEAYRGHMDFDEVVPISALKAENTGVLLEIIKSRLPAGPKYFPDDCVTDQPERRIVSELIREKILIFMQDEVPHGVAVEIIVMRKRDNQEIIDIDANIYCYKDSHKGMIIGKNGAMLKKIGQAARSEAEGILGSPIFLRLWVRVKKDWKNSDFLLNSFGLKG